MNYRALIIVSLCLSACARNAAYRDAPTPAKQGREAFEANSGFRIGHVDRALKPVRGKAKATSPYSTVELTYRGVNGTNVCFSFGYATQYYRGSGSLDRALADIAGGAKLTVLTFETRDALDDEHWPDTPPSQIATSRIRSYTLDKREETLASGAVKVTEWLNTTVEVCGPTPRVKPSSRYLTVTRYPSSAKHQPTFFVWTIAE